MNLKRAAPLGSQSTPHGAPDLRNATHASTIPTRLLPLHQYSTAASALTLRARNHWTTSIRVFFMHRALAARRLASPWLRQLSLALDKTAANSRSEELTAAYTSHTRRDLFAPFPARGLSLVLGSWHPS